MIKKRLILLKTLKNKLITNELNGSHGLVQVSYLTCRDSKDNEALNKNISYGRSERISLLQVWEESTNDQKCYTNVRTVGCV